MWDKAAAEYEAAVKLDPQKPEAQIKLKEVRRKQSGERLGKGRALLARGELAPGLTAIQEAATLDADSAEAQKALSDANAQVLAKAREFVDADETKKAFDLTSLVLKGSPNDPRAKELDSRVRDKLAEQAYDRADAFLKKNKLGNGLMELAAATSYRPGFRDAKLRLGQVKLALEQELMFTVVLDKFGDDGKSHDLAATLSPELVAQTLDDKLPLRVAAQAPASKDPHGVHVSGKFDGYAFVHEHGPEGHTCDYVCGTDTKPNPQYASAEQSVANAERQLASAEEEIARVQSDVDRYQKDMDSVQKDLDSAQRDADRARNDLDNCRAHQSPGAQNACNSEDSRMRQAQSSLDSVRQRASSPQSNLASARERLASATERRTSVRRDKDRETEHMRNTPRTIEVDRHCAHNYNVEVHTLSAGVTVVLSAEALQDKAKILTDEPFKYAVKKQDGTFPAQPGRCAEVANGKALNLPTEKQVKVELVTQTIAGVREKVMATYERYRQRFLADARREEAAGLGDEAVESYVRYLLTGPKAVDPKDQKQIAVFLDKARGFGKIDQLGAL
jgi:tetratricopeptide (TPR) repeat protein